MTDGLEPGHGGDHADDSSNPRPRDRRAVVVRIGVDKNGRTVLSRFLQDPSMPMMDELSFRGRSLVRRMVGQCGGPDASYGSRNGKGMGMGGGPKREAFAARRTH